MTTKPRALRALYPAEAGNLGYPFFRKHAQRPFALPATTQKQRDINAWWCSQLCMAAHLEDTAVLTQTLQGAGLALAGNIVETVDGLRGFVVTTGDTAFVVFRGTLLPYDGDTFEYAQTLLNWLTNLNGFPVRPPSRQGYAHRGFLEGWQRLVAKGLNVGQRTSGKTNVVWTGHSLGAALALMGAGLTRLENLTSSITTFGGPRIGDAAFLNTVNLPHARFVQGDDFIAVDPPQLLLLKFVLARYSQHGAPHPEPEGWPSPRTGRVLRLIRSQVSLDPAEDAAAMRELAEIPSYARDHSLLLYAALSEERLET